ncbi:MAG: TonB-dependent receptor [Gammaproteobacteria bacterium]|jgi:iron complex outermembrane recepter protein|nr:TonB-dependent receptor [Gammaproteobacteria bacterium]MBT5825278.1 TonB-dependent receptor [Gammaproteobacteria bacterium]MBT5966306.1 TonB-dependent receptor [Gammaproteobacteria bacterium]MBT6419500.1 TonB-dependent receptor [Gammaproteobacteria bacterium]MBT6576644.1 TonB-dependent receptor [Gammaproteobacteria bacterium]
MKKEVIILFNTAILLCFNVVYADESIEDSSPAEEVIYLDDMVIEADTENLTVSPQNSISADDIAKKQSQVSDTAKLLEDTAGMSFQAGGGVSSIPIIRGLNDTRVKIEVNGMTVNSICPNHMNPALASIDRSNIGSIVILKGITPVRMGGDSIAGTISVQSAKPKFAEAGEDFLLNGKLSSFYRSNGDAFGGSVGLGIANEFARLDYTGSDTQSKNYQDGNGTVIKSTNYENINQAFALSFNYDDQLLEIKGGQQHIPYQGFPTARMDLTNNDSLFGNIHYNGLFDWGNVDSLLFLEHTSHTMDYLPDRDATIFMPMETRGKNYGYKLQFELPSDEDDNIFHFGSEFHGSVINDYWPATSTVPSMMGPNEFINLNDATRNRFGVYAEWEKSWTDTWKTMLGFRYDRTWMNTGDVQGYNNITSNYLLTDYEQALAFNALDHERNFNAFDISMLVQYTPNDWSYYTLGYARKNRAPSVQELYPWSISPMPMTMIGWFGDGNGYVGNIDLKMETAHNIGFTANFSDSADSADEQVWNLEISPFFSYVENYIDADLCQECRKQPGNGYYYLTFENYDAYLWGVDITGEMNLFESPTYGEFSTNTIMSYVRGNRSDGDNLYNMMPFNFTWGVNHKLGGWQSAFNMQFVDTKNEVQEVRNELETSSYILLNFKTSFQWAFVTVDFGVDNILDHQYYYPLSGVYIGDQSAMTLSSSEPKTQNLPGQGRSVYVGVTLEY